MLVYTPQFGVNVPSIERYTSPTSSTTSRDESPKRVQKACYYTNGCLIQFSLSIICSMSIKYPAYHIRQLMIINNRFAKNCQIYIFN